MLISISIESVLKKVYAHSALRSYLSGTPSAVEPFLTPDNRQGLIPVLQEALSFIVVDLLPQMQVLAPPTSLTDFIQIELDAVNLPAGVDSLLETILAMRMLQIIHAPHSEITARQFAQLAENSSATLRSILRESSAASSPVTLRWNGY